MRVVALLLGSLLERAAERRLERGFGQRDDALPVRRRERMRRTETELEELAEQRRLGHALGLVGGEHDALARAAQVARDVVVVRRRAGPHIDDEDDRVGFSDRLLGLARHLVDDAGRVLGNEAAGVDDDELVPADLGISVMAVARQAGEVGDDRVARPGPAVEQGRLADVRPADQRDHGLHGCRRAGAMWAQLRRGGTRTRRPSA